MELIKKPLLPLVTTLTKETSHRFVAENPEKRARENAQWQQEVAKQVCEGHLLFCGVLTNQRAVHKGKT